MMAKLAPSFDDLSPKRLAAFVLPASHFLVGWYKQTWKQTERSQNLRATNAGSAPICVRDICLGTRFSRIGRCRRSVHRHKANLIAGTLACCQCNLCSLYACPENLDPKNVCVAAKPAARDLELFWSGDPASVEPHPLNRERRAPMRRLMTKLGLNDFHNVGPLEDRPLRLPG